jgi:membrane-bound metal-dependent hydrolase YbcI (DUF457 family)
MFIGHFGLGLAAKKAAPAVSLGLLFTAAQFLDLLWPTLLLLDVEQVTITQDPAAPIPLVFTHYPISHSLLMVLGWSVLFGAIYRMFRRDNRGAFILGVCVLSHWLLDLVVHLPDLPLYPGGEERVGFSLWRSPMATLAIEAVVFVTGIYLYLKSTTARNKWGKISFYILVSLLVLVHIANIFGEAPPSVEAIAWAGQLQWLFVIIAFWVDRNRDAVRKNRAMENTPAKKLHNSKAL